MSWIGPECKQKEMALSLKGGQSITEKVEIILLRDYIHNLHKRIFSRHS